MLTISNPTIVARDVTKEYRSRKTLFGKSPAPVTALKDVSLVASKGESIGLIGKNGSGKSTLLKLIAGGERPTKGEVRVSSQPTLLGVSAALQSQLSGIKNIELGLLAMGLSRAQVKELSSQVAEWSDIGDAIERPMKTYSSGMQSRLKFAISTAVKQEILLVDEALSTGDATFKQKAQERMESFIEGAGTVFLVAHSSKTIAQYCSRAIWLHKGEIINDGPCEVVNRQYDHWSRLVSMREYGKASGFIVRMKRENPLNKVLFDTEAAKFMKAYEQ